MIFGVDRTVTTVVGTMVGTGVATVGGPVGGIVGTGVGTVVVTATGCAGWVHPLITIRAITRISNPINFFMEITL